MWGVETWRLEREVGKIGLLLRNVINLCDYTGETILVTTYTHYGNLIQVP